MPYWVFIKEIIPQVRAEFKMPQRKKEKTYVKVRGRAFNYNKYKFWSFMKHNFFKRR